MKTILFSPITSGFCTTRYKTLMHNLLLYFNVVTDFSYIKSFFNHDQLIYFEQPTVSKSQLINQYKEEYAYCNQRLDDIALHYQRPIRAIEDSICSENFVRMMSRYHSVKTILEHHQEISIMFICPTEGFLIDLAQQHGIKTIFLEHAPNFFPTQLLENSLNQFIPFESKLPDYIVSENHITTMLWNTLIDQKQPHTTTVINSGLPLDSSNYDLTPKNISQNNLTLTIFNTWLCP